MSYSVSISREETSPGEDNPRSVSVAVADQPAGVADELALGQFQSLLGSRSTIGTCHSRIGGRHQHHLPTHPLGIVDKFTLGCSDGGVLGFARHRGLGEEPRFEVLHSDSAVGATIGIDWGVGVGQRLVVTTDDETGVPVPEGVAVDADTGRVGRQSTGPHDGDAQSTVSSNRSKDERRGCFARSSPRSSPGFPRCGLTRTSSQQSAERRWRWSSSMWKTNATSSTRFLPTAKAGGIHGGDQ